MPKECRFAGVSIFYDKPTVGVHTPKFHCTKLEKQIAVWMKVPGKAMYIYIELPKDMTKLEAIRYCANAKEFQEPKFVRDYLITLAKHFDPEAKKEEKLKKKNEGIEKIKRTYKKRTKVATPIHMLEETAYGEDDLDENDIPEELMPEKKEDC